MVEEQDTRERIIAAALRVVRRDGVRSLTSTEVAREAGLRQSHLTYYFPTARALRQAAMQHFVEAMLGRLEHAAKGGRKAGLRALHALVTEPAHMRLLAGLVVEAETDAELRGIFLGALSRFDEAVAALLGRTARDPATRQLVATLWGLGLRRLVTREAAPAGEAARLQKSFEKPKRAPARRKS